MDDNVINLNSITGGKDKSPEEFVYTIVYQGPEGLSIAYAKGYVMVTDKMFLVMDREYHVLFGCPVSNVHKVTGEAPTEEEETVDGD